MAKFKVGQMVEDFERGVGKVTQINNADEYPVSVEFESSLPDEYTVEGERWRKLKPVLRLAGRPFNVGDRVVIGENKGVVRGVNDDNQFTGVMISMEEDGEGIDTIWVTSDGRAWPGTPIICEHDWEEEEVEKINKELDEAVKNSNAFSEYQNQEKEDFDISPGFAKDWPIDNGIEDVTVSPEEVRHIAEMQDIDELEYRKMPKYIKMALALEGIEVDLKTADLIREIVDSVNAHGGQYDLDTSCNIRQQIEEKYV